MLKPGDALARSFLPISRPGIQHRVKYDLRGTKRSRISQPQPLTFTPAAPAGVVIVPQRSLNANAKSHQAAYLQALLRLLFCQHGATVSALPTWRRRQLNTKLCQLTARVDQTNF